MNTPIPVGRFETFMTSLIIFAVGVLAVLLLFLGIARAQVPESVLLFNQMRSLLPGMQDRSQPLGGLSVCKLLEKRDQPQPFLAQPSDQGKDTCDLSTTILAYGGWGTADIEDAVTGLHFTKPACPSVEIVQYGEWTVIYLNHRRKKDVPRTPEGAEAARRELSHIRAQFEAGVQPTLVKQDATPGLFPGQCENLAPLPKERR